VAFKIRQNPFSAGDPAGAAHNAPSTLVDPCPHPTPLGTDPPSALAMRLHRIPARSTPTQ